MSDFVSIIIPSRNEEKFIGKCLDSILEQDYPKDNLEVLVVDGMSEDKTREIVEDYSKKHSFIKMIDNPEIYTPFGLNIAIEEAKGDIIVRMDAHAGYQNDYVSKCIHFLNKERVDNVGGIIKTMPGGKTTIAKAIALSLSHVFGAGNSYFRIGSLEPQFVDTVFRGCYRKEIFEKIGKFNEQMLRSQDFEFNLRLKENNGKILLVPNIISFYYSQPTLWGFIKHNFTDGVWITYPYFKFKIEAFSWRHLVPLFFVSMLFFGFFLAQISTGFLLLLILFISLYLAFSFYFSFKIAKRQKDFIFFFILPFIFLARHVPYGLGSIWGAVKYFLEKYRAIDVKGN